jgi:hypothetical protein
MKKTIFCAVMFTCLSTSANFLQGYESKTENANLVESLAKDKNFLKMTSLSFNLIQKVEKSKSLELIKKYHKGDITIGEKNRLFLNPNFLGEAELLALYKRIYLYRNNVLKSFPELQNKSKDELAKLISDVVNSKFYTNNISILYNAKYPLSRCWTVWSASMLFCFINFDIESVDYAICMAAAWDGYGLCSLFAD